MSGMQSPLDVGALPPERAARLRPNRLRNFMARLRERRRRNGARHGRFGLIITLVMLLMVVVFLIPFSVVFIGPGSGGVLWERFNGGTQYQIALGEGFHLIWPWDRIYIYDLQLQNWHEDLYALTSDGLSLSVEVAARYRLSPENLAYLQDAVGRDYVQKIISPQVGAAVRKLIALYPVESLLGPLRNQVQDVIFNTLTDRSRLNEMGALDAYTGSDHNHPVGQPVEDSGPAKASHDGHVNVKVNTLNRPLILLQDLLISRIVMPESVQKAINAKLEEAERAQQYNYTLAAERDEAERQAIKAEGIRHFDDIVGPTLSKPYLMLRGIEATEALARSPNAKVVVVGGSNGLPLILNTGDAGALSAAGGGVSATGGGASAAPQPGQPPSSVAPGSLLPQPTPSTPVTMPDLKPQAPAAPGSPSRP